MEERERIRRWNDKEDLIDEVRAALGKEPIGLRQALAVLSHPEILEHTIKYFTSLDDNKHVCVKHAPPWDCAKETESRYDDSDYWWLNSPHTKVIPGHWCNPCRQQALNNQQ